MHRFFVPAGQISNGRITITGSDINHIKNVLRLKPGDKIRAIDGAQNIYICELEIFNREFIRGRIISKETSNIESRINLTLAQCLPKGKKMDLIVKMAVELGVKEIIPVISERSIPKIEEKEEKKIAHWQTIAKEAAEQSGRSIVPQIGPLTHLNELNPKDYDLAIMPWEGENKKSLKDVLTTKQPNHLMLLIGPEGGFSHDEADKAKQSGFNTISLGKRILRCETAAVAAVSQIFYELNG